jgi:hypothetical protein
MASISGNSGNVAILKIHTDSFTTRALEKKRKQKIAFGCVILKKKKSNLKDIPEKTT